MRLTLLLLLCFALPAYADTLTVQVDRDNGTTQITDSVPFTPAAIGAQPDVKGADGIDIFQNSTGARFPYIDFHSNDTYPDYTARIAQWNSGALQFFNANAATMPANGSAYSFEGTTGTFRIKQPAILQIATAPPDAWDMYPAITNAIEFPKLGVGSVKQGFASWLVSAGPTSAHVTANGNGSSWGILGQEINTLERYADQGYKESRTGRWSGALQLVPESELSTFGTNQQGYNGNFGLIFAHSWGAEYDGARTFPSVKWHVPLLFDENCTTPAGTTVLFKGGATVGGQANKTIKAIGYHNDVIDTAGATVAGAVLKVAPTQTFSDGAVTKTLAQLAAGPYTASGDTTVAATVSGAKTAGKQLTFDANGNVIASAYDAGATGGGGSGTVSSGTTGQFAYYSGAGTTVTGRTLVAGDIPAISESGVTNLTSDLAAKAPLAPSYITIGADATLTNERVLTGTSNRITVTDGGAGGAVTLSTPQDIATTSVSRFAGLNINGGMGATAGQILMNGNSGTATFQMGGSYFVDVANSLNVSKVAATGTATIDIDPKVTDGTSAATVRYFRNTATTAPTILQVHRGQSGDDASQINSAFKGNGDSYVQSLTGNFGVGTNNPGKKLDVNGVARAKSFEETVKANGTCSTSINIDPTLGGIHTLTLSGACAIGVTNLAAGQSFTVDLTQSGTVRPTFSSAFLWPNGGTQPVWSNTAGKLDFFACKANAAGDKLICSGMTDLQVTP